MEIAVRDAKELDFACDALILPLFEDEGMDAYPEIDRGLGGLPSKIMATGEFRAKHGRVFLLHTFGKIKPRRLLFAGLGLKADATREKVRQSGGKAASCLRETGAKDIGLSTRTLSALPPLLPADFVEGALLSQYRFKAYKKEEDEEKGEIKSLTTLSAEDWKGRIRRLVAVEAGTRFARDLVNTPANDMTPSALAEAALGLKKVKVKIIEKKEAEKLGMGAYLSVARGSAQPPKFIVVNYEARKALPAAPLALVGKSITFDSGGISLKPSEGMEKMKYDMAGGAAVLGAIKAASELELPVSVAGVLPACENLPGGSASKPGDIVRTITGKTVEIVNTDAEGRLALADAIGYVRRSFPGATIIDIATLTGACSIALGDEAIAMMGTSEELIARIKAASAETGEKVWQMPLYEEYKHYIESEVADLKNSGGRSGSLVTAGYFLKEFAEAAPWTPAPWAHLDIAGTAWTDKDRPYMPKGATGIGVRLLLNFLENLTPQSQK
ncbi:MAG: leucyl aminopeptidase [Nitrospiraceae bacterium]|nr:leucyl aminopeptidase [Nitrospiraceae bacterium]